MKKIRFLLFMLLALFYVTNANALIVGNRFERDGITYEVTAMEEAHDGLPKRFNVKFVSSKMSGVVNIPAKVKDYPANQYEFDVTAIDNNSTVPNATSVVIPASVTTIGANAFQVGHIESIEIPATVTDIQSGAFSQMKSLKEIKVAAGNAKYSAYGGVLYEMDGSKKYLAGYPVAKPDANYTVPEGVVGVRTNAVQGALNLTAISLPASLKELPATKDGNGFTSCKKLTAINVNSANTTFKSVDGVVLSHDGKELVAYPCGRKGVIDPSYDLTTDPGAEKGNVYKIPDGVEKIREGAFTSVEYLTAVELATSTTTIEKGAFTNMRNLRDVKIASHVASIGDGAFFGDIMLQKIKVDAANTTYKDDDGVLYDKAGKNLISFPAGRAREYTTLNTTENIKPDAFRGAAKVTKVTLNTGLKTIGQDAFQQTKALKTINFGNPSTLEEIGQSAFWGSGLEKVELPASLKKLGTYAFKSNTNLKEVTVAGGSQLEYLGDRAFESCSNLETFKFLGTNSLKTIGTSAFGGDSKLTSFNIPKGVTNIKTGAFDGCSSMKTVTFEAPAQVTTISEGAFQGASALERIELPESVTTIGKDAFNKCKSLKEIVIPKNVTSIDPTGFQECAALEKFTVDPANAVYSSVDGFLLSKDKKVLKAFPPAKAGTYYTLLPPTIEEIGKQAFYYVQELENVTIPEKVKKIDKFAFDRVAKLNTIAFLSKVPIADVDPSAFNPDNVDKSKISLSIRKDAAAAFNSDAFWNQFPNRLVSFDVETNGIGNGVTEFFPLSQKAVMVVDVKADVFTYVVPAKVKNAGDSNKEYEVRLWADYGLQHAPANVKFEEIVFRNQLDYVGLEAFEKADGSSTVKRIFFTCKKPAKDMSATKWEYGNAQHEFKSDLKIYVKKSVIDDYKSVAGHEHAGWNRYANQIEYKIPYYVTSAAAPAAAPKPLIKKKYGTFAREFDTDFGSYFAEEGKGKVAAFVTPISGVESGPGDYGHSTYMVKMSSIDLNGGAANDYSYIPAETGVLLKVLETEALPVDFYYTIGEKDDVTYSITGNMMTGIVVKDQIITVGSTPVYVVSGNKGIFKKARTGSLNMPVHKAYAKISGVPAGAKIAFVFDDGTEATGIEAIDDSEAKAVKHDVYYRLNGQCIEKPQHGVCIKNGKKIIIK